MAEAHDFIGIYSDISEKSKGSFDGFEIEITPSSLTKVSAVVRLPDNLGRIVTFLAEPSMENDELVFSVLEDHGTTRVKFRGQLEGDSVVWDKSYSSGSGRTRTLKAGTSYWGQ